MNLNDIKGIVEINGLKFNPKDILQALVEQGLKVHSLNGTLLIGRSFIDQSPELKVGDNSCTMSSYCKIYDKLNNTSTCDDGLKVSSSDMQKQLDSLGKFPSNFQPEPSRAYVERVQIDNDDIDITDLYSNSNSPHNYKPFPFNDPMPAGEFDMDEAGDYTEPTEMMGVSPLTKYGSSKMDIASIPQKHRGRCPYCGTTINVNWKFCGNCGNTT
ncbi:MAG: zinc ribbon domain-containing protein [Candidatus Heimdallarchaeota archaeon]|nr:zinc ribbon domain-containing protein [Candidatus Heimdallarchaeota archaeon]